jgi:hypothetical protein
VHLAAGEPAPGAILTEKGMVDPQRIGSASVAPAREWRIDLQVLPA